MSHRALVAIRRPDGRYDCYDVADGPAAGSEAEWIVGNAGWEPGFDALPGAWAGDGRVERAARGVAFEAVVDGVLDPLLHESLVVIDPGGEVRTYVVVPYLMATAEGLHPDAVTGAAVALEGFDGSRLSPGYVRAWHHGVTETLGEAIDRGLLSPAEAVGWLDDAVRRLAGDRREVIDVPASG